MVNIKTIFFILFIILYKIYHHKHYVFMCISSKILEPAVTLWEHEVRKLTIQGVFCITIIFQKSVIKDPTLYL